MVSILYGKKFKFSDKQKLELRFKDMLEDDVDEKYYLSDKMVNFFYDNEKKQKEKGNGFRFGVTDGNCVAKAVTTNAGGRMDDNFIKSIQVGKLDIKGQDNIKRVYSDKGLSPGLTTMQGGNRQPKILEEPFIVASRGRNPENPSSRKSGEQTEQRLEQNTSGTTNTITTVQKDNYVAEPKIVEERSDEGLREFKDNICGTLRTIDSCGDKRVIEGYRIRKLTPRECLRLMGVRDKEIDKFTVSDSQKYKQAGNSIVVNVLIAIFKNLFIDKKYENTLF